MKLFPAFVAFLIMSTLPVPADLIVPGASLMSSGPPIGDYVLSADNGLDPEDSSWFGAFVGLNLAVDGPTSATLSSGSGILTPGHMWYEVYADQSVDPALVLGSTTAFYVGFQPDYGHVVEDPLQIDVDVPFYLGFWIANGLDPTPDAGDVFGWAELVYDGTSLQLLDSAVENAWPGIVAGSYEPIIPEPSVFALMALGAAGVALCRRRKQCRC